MIDTIYLGIVGGVWFAAACFGFLIAGFVFVLIVAFIQDLIRLVAKLLP